VDGWRFVHRLAATVSVNIVFEPVPYHRGNFIGWNCRTIDSQSGEVVDALRLFVSAPWLTADERAWDLWRGVLSTLNRAARIPPAEQALLRADARAFVKLLQGTYP